MFIRQKNVLDVFREKDFSGGENYSLFVIAIAFTHSVHATHIGE